MARAKAETVKRVSNVRTQAITETLVGRESMLVIRLKGGEYTSTNKPLSECILYNVDHQLISSNAFARLFHGGMVIGLRYKYTAKKTSNKVQKVGEIVHYFPE